MWSVDFFLCFLCLFFFSSRRRHTRCALVTGVQTCALPIYADAFVRWGSNMAEMHPILWTRLADRRLGQPHVRVAVLSTFTHRSMDLADIPIIFKPGTDLAVLNYIAHHIISTGQIGRAHV